LAIVVVLALLGCRSNRPLEDYRATLLVQKA
jgi:hypothetical protein